MKEVTFLGGQLKTYPEPAYIFSGGQNLMVLMLLVLSTLLNNNRISIAHHTVVTSESKPKSEKHYFQPCRPHPLCLREKIEPGDFFFGGGGITVQETTPFADKYSSRRNRE